jgi:hypothetical protein
MSDVTNLNRFRKHKARASKRAQADANAVKHGRTKAQKEAERLRAEQAARALEAHRKAEAT